MCVYDTELWRERVLVIFDAVSSESWPRLRGDEVSYDPVVRQKWIDRYNRLRLENPSLPQYFTESAS